MDIVFKQTGSKHFIRRLLADVLICLVMGGLFLTGCQKTDSDIICDSVSDRFEPYKSHGEDVVWRLSKTAEDEGLTTMGISGQEFADALLDGFDYSVKTVKVSGKKAEVEVDITSKSMSALRRNLSQVASSLAKIRSQADEAEKTAEIRDWVLNAVNETETVQEGITLIFQLEGNEWKSDNATEELGKLDSAIFSG